MMDDIKDVGVIPLQWRGGLMDGHVGMLDQRRLPLEEIENRYSGHVDIAASIHDMVVRGAPAIGITAAFGVFLGARESVVAGRDPFEDMPGVLKTLGDTRPTAVNLFWALEVMRKLAEANRELAQKDPEAFLRVLRDEAVRIHREDIENNRVMGRHGAELVPDGGRILTHCNAGALATGGYGTALGVVRAAHSQGKLAMTYADETRPYLQGARLTAWELHKDNIPVTLITDSMAGHFMQKGEIDLVVVGTDRTVANGDVANKIGTYSVAVLCKHHGIPFYVAAPLSTIDLDTKTGEGIVIEERTAAEVTTVGDTVLAPDGIKVRHPAFDVTPAELVTGIITEKGVARAPYTDSLAELKRNA